ncbi:hypothetical protein PIB30_082616 [Stylosanthes scabra]|uniref:Transmembrane protein n=1 Tax=Stylosanthes scabra TaxID=79078 RepID=A0ABU6QS89_9FABA|nr:hypothetical protein [Stylosanthes scabra]
MESFPSTLIGLFCWAAHTFSSHCAIGIFEGAPMNFLMYEHDESSSSMNCLQFQKAYKKRPGLVQANVRKLVAASPSATSFSRLRRFFFFALRRSSSPLLFLLLFGRFIVGFVVVVMLVRAAFVVVVVALWLWLCWRCAGGAAVSNGGGNKKWRANKDAILRKQSPMTDVNQRRNVHGCSPRADR